MAIINVKNYLRMTGFTNTKGSSYSKKSSIVIYNRVTSILFFCGCSTDCSKGPLTEDQKHVRGVRIINHIKHDKSGRGLFIIEKYLIGVKELPIVNRDDELYNIFFNHYTINGNAKLEIRRRIISYNYEIEEATKSNNGVLNKAEWVRIKKKYIIEFQQLGWKYRREVFDKLTNSQIKEDSMVWSDIIVREHLEKDEPYYLDEGEAQTFLEGYVYPYTVPDSRYPDPEEKEEYAEHFKYKKIPNVAINPDVKLKFEAEKERQKKYAKPYDESNSVPFKQPYIAIDPELGLVYQEDVLYFEDGEEWVVYSESGYEIDIDINIRSGDQVHIRINRDLLCADITVPVFAKLVDKELGELSKNKESMLRPDQKYSNGPLYTLNDSNIDQRMTSLVDPNDFYEYYIKVAFINLYIISINHEKVGKNPALISFDDLYRELITSVANKELYDYSQELDPSSFIKKAGGFHFYEDSYKTFINQFFKAIVKQGIIFQEPKVNGSPLLCDLSPLFTFPKEGEVPEIPFVIPIVCKPKDWSYNPGFIDAENGGYLKVSLRKTLQAATYTKKQIFLKPDDVGVMVIENINYLQSIPKTYQGIHVLNFINFGPESMVLFDYKSVHSLEACQRYFGYPAGIGKHFLHTCIEYQLNRFSGAAFEGSSHAIDWDPNAVIESSLWQVCKRSELFKTSINNLRIIERLGHRNFQKSRYEGRGGNDVVDLYDVFNLDSTGRPCPVGEFNATASLLVRSAMRFSFDDNIYQPKIASLEEGKAKIVNQEIWFATALFTFGKGVCRDYESAVILLNRKVIKGTLSLKENPSTLRIPISNLDIVSYLVDKPENYITNPVELFSLLGDNMIEWGTLVGKITPETCPQLDEVGEIPTLEYKPTDTLLSIIAVAAGLGEDDLQYFDLNTYSSELGNFGPNTSYSYAIRECLVNALDTIDSQVIGYGCAITEFLRVKSGTTWRVITKFETNMVKELVLDYSFVTEALHLFAFHHKPLNFKKEFLGFLKAYSAKRGMTISEDIMYEIFKFVENVIKETTEALYISDELELLSLRVEDLKNIDRKLSQDSGNSSISFPEVRDKGTYLPFVHHSPLGKANLSKYSTIRGISFNIPDNQGTMKRMQPRHAPFILPRDGFEGPSAAVSSSYGSEVANIMFSYVIHEVIRDFREKELPLHPTNDGFIVRLDHLPELKKAYLCALIKLNKYYSDFAHKNGKKNFREFTESQKASLLENSNFCLVPAADYGVFMSRFLLRQLFLSEFFFFKVVNTMFI